MNAYAFQRADGELAVEAWRPLDRALYRWVIAHGGDPLLAATAAWASFAEGSGDAALPLADGRHGMPPLSHEQIERLRASPLVASDAAHGMRPFVLDADGRFYLWRNHAHECDAAARIRARRAASSSDAPEAAALDADLDALFHGDRSARVGPQREAVRRVPGKRLFVLTGGPGTGKTTTVLRMLLMLQRHAPAPLSIQIAAPTGKAAQRLLQALRQGKANLRNHAAAPLPADWWPLLDTIPDTEALTLHRLLGYQPWRNAFRRNARDPIAADVVVVDEASMVDLAMLRCLLDAVREDATLILVGDADQLTSVATGSVLLDLVAAFDADPRGELVRLVHSFRAERHLVAINEAVRAGDSAALAAALAAAGDQAAQYAVADEAQLRAQLARWARELAALGALRPVLPTADAKFTAALSEDSSAIGNGAPSADSSFRRRPESSAFETSEIQGNWVPASAGTTSEEQLVGATDRTTLIRTALATLGQRQLLCALRETAFGSVAINAALEALLRRVWQVDAHAEWYPGRAVIITRNDYPAGLFNGDVGLCLSDADGNLRVWFETTAGEGGDTGVRSFAPHTLPAHEPAFAITIHKSQGSEYRLAAVLLPPDADHRILSRQLLYTGVSRAKQSVEVWCTQESLNAAVVTEVRRAGGLQGRLGPA